MVAANLDSDTSQTMVNLICKPSCLTCLPVGLFANLIRLIALPHHRQVEPVLLILQCYMLKGKQFRVALYHGVVALCQQTLLCGFNVWRETSTDIPLVHVPRAELPCKYALSETFNGMSLGFIRDESLNHRPPRLPQLLALISVISSVALTIKDIFLREPLSRSSGLYYQAIEDILIHGVESAKYVSLCLHIVIFRLSRKVGLRRSNEHG